MTKQEFLQRVGVSSEEEFYKKYPSEEAFRKAHPDIPEMGLGGFLKGLLPTALGFIPGVGGVLSGAASTLLNKPKGQGLSGEDKNGLIGAGVQVAGSLIKGLFNKKNATGVAPITAPAAGAAQLINNMQMQSQARQSFMQGIQPMAKAIADQFGEDEQPILFQRGGRYMIDDADILPHFARSAANAEVESGEVVQDFGGNIEYVDPSAPHTADHEQGGALMHDAHRVLEATSGKAHRKNWKDRILKMSPDDVFETTGYRPDKPMSHAKALLESDKAFGKERGKYVKAIKKVTDMKKPDKISLDTARINYQIGKRIPTREQLFDDLFQHQESVKEKYAIDSGEEMQYGGIRKMQDGGEDPPKKKKQNVLQKSVGKGMIGNRPLLGDIHFGDEIRSWFTASPRKPGIVTKPPIPGQEPASSHYGTWDPIYGRKDPVDGLHPEQAPGQFPVIREETLPEVKVAKRKKGTVTFVQPRDTVKPAAKSVTTTAPAATVKLPMPTITDFDNAVDKDFRAANPEPERRPAVTGIGPTMDGGRSVSVENDIIRSRGEAGNTQQGSGFVPERMQPEDYMPLAQALTLRKSPVRFTPVEMERAKLKRVSARPYLENNAADYKAALRMAGDDAGAVAQLYANKYRIDNQVMGNVENQNVQISNQEELTNTEIGNREKLLQAENLNQFDQKVNMRDANYNSAKSKLLDQFAQNSRSNRAFNRNMKYMLEFAGRGLYDKNGNYVGGPSVFTDASGQVVQGNPDVRIRDRNIRYEWGPDGRQRVAGSTEVTTNPRKQRGGKLKVKLQY